MGIGIKSGSAGDIEPSRPPDVAQQYIQNEQRSHPLGVVPIPDHMAPWGDDRPRPVGSHLPGHLPDHLRRDFRDRGGPLRRERLNMFDQAFKADGVFLDVFPIVKALRDQNMHPRQQERRVGSGLDGKPAVGLHRRCRVAGIHHHQLRPTGQRAGEILHHRVMGVFPDVVPDEDDIPGVLPVHRLMASDPAPEGDLSGDLPRSQTEASRRLPYIRAAKGKRQIIPKPEIASRMSEPCHRFRAILIPQAGQRFRRPVQGLLPARLPERPRPTLAGANQRLAQAIRIIKVGNCRLTSTAEAAAAFRIFGVPLHLHHAAVHGVDPHAAAPHAHIAVVVSNPHFLRAVPRPADRTGPQESEHGLPQMREPHPDSSQGSPASKELPTG
ncbi:hypothetical protein HRbin22_02481 [Candidatus Thermoflexus japonica]|uniref:Uncharacterized protein n=1 Tax=Candidatus Thermoflexus japonica TaxID=2035417 RepID=A0A2H5Y9T9_9CHLR|nr:hypothetical protein HRbin22_02481 [Candidatus Thermoflexus japonica]